MLSRWQIQRLMDLPYAGQAKSELVMSGRWDDSDLKSTRKEPIELTVHYEGGYSVTDCGDREIVIRLN